MLVDIYIMAFSSEAASTASKEGNFFNNEEIPQAKYDPAVTHPKLIQGISHGIVVSGEASESDEELDSRPVSDLPSPGSDFSPSESWERQSGSDTLDPSRDERLRYNTLLHRKLWEKNQALRKDLVEIACQPYQTASKEIHTISQQLIKSQLLVQDVSSTLRRLTNELFALEERVQSIRSGSFLPDIDSESIPPLDTP